MKAFGGRDVPQYLAPYAAYLSSTPYGSKLFNKCIGYLTRIAGLLFAAWGHGLYQPSHLALLSPGDASLSVSAGIGLSVVGAALFMSARNFLARGALTGLAQDHRSPVVYLRSFKSDVRLFETPSQVLALLIGHASQTYEWSLAKATAAIGPLVAIGKPGENLPPGGAARLYVDNDHWQQVATELVSVAKLVVLRVGQTRGFLWELRHVVAQCDPRKVVVFLPATDRGALYGYLREQAAEILPSPLPPDPGNALFLAFGPGWEPRFIGAPANRFFELCRRLFRSPSGVLRDALVSIAGEDREFVRKIAIRKSIPLLCLCYLVSNVIAYTAFESIFRSFDTRLFFLFFSNNDPQFYFTAFLFGYFIFAVVSVLLFQRFGPRRWIAGMMLATGLLCAATYVSRDMIYLLVIRFLLGAALAGLIPAIVSYIAALVPAGHRARWIGLVMLAIPLASVPTQLAHFLGAAMATELPAPGMIYAALMRGLFGGAAPDYARIPALTDWQGFYVLQGVFAISLAIGAMVYMRDELTDGSSSAAEAARFGPVQPGEKIPGPARGASRSSLTVLALSIVWPSLIAIAASVAHAGSELTVGLNMPLWDFLYFAWLSPFVFALCMMVWAWHADHTGERKWHAIAPLLIAVFGVWAAAIANSMTTKAWAGLATGVGMFAVVPILWTSAVELALSTSLAAQIATIVAVGTMLETLFWVFESNLLGTAGPIGVSSLALIAAVVFAILCRPHRIESASKPATPRRQALTFADWDACAAYGGCESISDSGFGRDRQPVINVTWDNARQYVAWLSSLTGQPYRLLTEAEYEYAARAGMQTAYPWGDEIGNGNADCAGCGSRWDNMQPAPGGSFAPNQFGLYDMVGNVWAWVEDCAHVNYNDAPRDGSAWLEGGTCTSRVARGGSWDFLPLGIRSGNRGWHPTGTQANYLGLRVGRTLSAGTGAITGAPGVR